MKIRWGQQALGAMTALWLSLASATAFAQQDPEGEDGDEIGTAGDAEAVDGEPSDSEDAPVDSGGDDASADVRAPAGDSSSIRSVGLERLPGTGYPEPRVRGIAQGSMWLNMHGLQWPYMPALSGDPATRIGLSGNVWVDTSYRSVDSGLPDTDPSLKEWRQQARLVLRATPTYNAGDDWFVQGQGEIVLNGAAPTRVSEDIVADDLYVRVGKWNVFDVTVGRQQGWEIYHLGMGLDLNTVERDGARTDNNRPVDLYGLTHYWDRPNGPGRVAAHYYPTDYLRFEVLGQIGGASLNALGVRPVGILDLGIIKVKAGAEYGKETPRQQSADRKDSIILKGLGAAVQVVVDPHFEAGVSAAQGLVDTFNAQGVLDAGRSTTTRSYGGFANVRVIPDLILGAGVTYTEDNNLKLDVTETLNDIRSHLQIFGAAQYALWGQFYVKAVVSHADAHFNPLSDPPPIAEFRNKMLSGRLRVMYMY